MYSNIESVQILIKLLKEYNIKNVVLAPGGSDIPIIHSIETDEFFNCYSVVDERSAVYFAMGVSQQNNAPVACVCTSGTAVSNFLPGMTEAYYQNVPIVAITADKDPLRQGHLETQKIEQNNILDTVCKKTVELPVIRSKEESWYCGRLINEALVELDHHGKGPVQINIPIVGKTSIYSCETLPDVKKINLITATDQGLDKYIEKLSKAKKILIVLGQNIVFSDEDKKNVELFAKKYNCIISVEHMSNLNCEGVVYTYPVTEIFYMKGALSDLVPDIVISMGNNIASYKMKPFLREHSGTVEHWQVDESGRIRDMFECLTDVMEFSPQFFFKYFAGNAPKNISNDKIYFKEWQKYIDNITYPEFNFSNFYVAQELSKVIPDKSILHLAILNSTRVMQFFPLGKNVKVYSNIGALGIDGCLSTFIGQAAGTDELAFCLVGDLSFFYDMNAAGIRHIGSNVRIILLNNGGGSEFHFFMGKRNIPTINTHICAEHKKTAKGWIESLGYDYYSASTKEELATVMPKLSKKSDKPIFVEVFTDMEDDANYTNKFYSDNSVAVGGAKTKLIHTAKNILSDKQIEKGKKLLGKFKK